MRCPCDNQCLLARTTPRPKLRTMSLGPSNGRECLSYSKHFHTVIAKSSWRAGGGRLREKVGHGSYTKGLCVLSKLGHFHPERSREELKEFQLERDRS